METMHKHAHQSGDGITVMHCPMCGSGQIVGRSDGNIECAFCNTAFFVRIQPMFSAFPQNVNGIPVQIPDMPPPSSSPGGMPGGMAPGDPSVADAEAMEGNEPESQPSSQSDDDDDDSQKPPWMKKSYRTSSGHTMSAPDYIAYLAGLLKGEK